MQAGTRVDFFDLLWFLFSCRILSSLKKLVLATCYSKCQKETENEVEHSWALKSLIRCALQKHSFWLILEQATQHQRRRAGPGREPGFQSQISTGLPCDLVLYPVGAPAFFFHSVIITSVMCVHACVPMSWRGNFSGGRGSARREEAWVKALIVIYYLCHLGQNQAE